MIKMIFACDKITRCIGQDGQLPWRLKMDLMFFKNMTMGHYVLCGRKTYESLPKLEGRKFFVLTSEKNYRGNLKNPICKSFDSVESFMDFYSSFDEDVFVIGGASVYKAFEKYADELIVDEISPHDNLLYNGDTFIFDYHENFTKVKLLDAIFDSDKKVGDHYNNAVYLEMQLWKKQNKK